MAADDARRQAAADMEAARAQAATDLRSANEAAARVHETRLALDANEAKLALRQRLEG